jgi:hypothetical protein
MNTSVQSGTRAPEDVAAQTSTPGVFHSAIALAIEMFIDVMVRATGKRIREHDAPWLQCYLGQPGVIGTGVYQRIAAEEHLELRNSPHAGLLADFNDLRGPSFDPENIHPRVRHFYEHAAEYQMEVWSEVYFVGRFFLWLLVEFLTRRMDQLNFPISSLEVAKGMASEVIQMVDPASGKLLYTGWLRRLKSSGRVIYAGIYSVARVPGEENPCVKVTFPCRGSANVYLRPLAHNDGSLGLDSSGSGFGKSGFYRLLEAGPDHWRVRNFRSLHELFHVYVDDEEVLRVDHKISFVGMTILRLHYKVTPVSIREVLPADPNLVAAQQLAP